MGNNSIGEEVIELINHRDLRFIRRALAGQGFHIVQTPNRFWIIVGEHGRAAFLRPEADLIDWHNALMRLKETGLIDWPPEW